MFSMFRRRGDGGTGGEDRGTSLSHPRTPLGRQYPHRVSVFGVLGDPHAEDQAAEAAIAFLRAQGADTLVCTGDVIDGPGDESRTVDLLRAADVVTVRGNHDRLYGREVDYEVRQRAAGLDMSGQPAWWARLPQEQGLWLHRLPECYEFSTPAGRVLLCHGVGQDDMNHLRVDDYGYAVEQNLALWDIVSYRLPPVLMVKGHTHRSGVANFHGMAVVDAGTLLREHDPCVWLVDTARRTATRWSMAGGRVLVDTAATSPW